MKRILVVEDDLALSAGLCFELDSGGLHRHPRLQLRQGRDIYFSRSSSLRWHCWT